jgi:hypothetical protein
MTVDTCAEVVDLAQRHSRLEDAVLEINQWSDTDHAEACAGMYVIPVYKAVLLDAAIYERDRIEKRLIKLKISPWCDMVFKVGK